MLAVVDAFDAMTSDRVYRRAYSRERALTELFQNAGTQFDPELVKDFYDRKLNVENKTEECIFLSTHGICACTPFLSL